MTKRMLFIALLILISGLIELFAQQIHSALTTAGGNLSGSGGSISYSVGQLLYTTAESAKGTVAHGVQQPYEISVISGIDEIYDIKLFAVYPNPANNFLILKLDLNELSNFSYQLLNIDGKILKQAKIKDKETGINMSALKPASYIIRIFCDNNEVKTFKIIKN
jgi:hypothetical protein